MTTKIYAPKVFDALGEALRTSYWYKADLRSFLIRSGLTPEALAVYNWGQGEPYKRQIIRDLLDRLLRRGPDASQMVRALIDATVEQDPEFPHLRKLEDGERKAEEARVALRHLQELVGQATIAERAARAHHERRLETARRAAEVAERKAALESVASSFQSVAACPDPQQRGREFEDVLRRLFAAFDLNPRGAFCGPGEQTDGSIVLDSTYVLVEAKWRASPASPDQVNHFRAKVEEKLDNTLGLFVSMSGFTTEAQARATHGRRVLVLVDGEDIAVTMDGTIDLVDLLRRKFRHAAETGGVLFKPYR